MFPDSTLASYRPAVEMQHLINHILIGNERYITHKVIERVNNHIRQDITHKIVNMNYQEFYEKNSGEYISWYLNDVNQMETQGLNTFFDFICNVGTFLINNSLVLLYFHWGLLLTCLGEAAIAGLISQKMQGGIGKQAEELSVSMENYSDQMKEQIAGVPVIRNYKLAERFYSRMYSCIMKISVRTFCLAQSWMRRK